MFVVDRVALGVTSGGCARNIVLVWPPMALSSTGIRSAKARLKQYRFHDEGGLFLIVKPSGGKLWRFKDLQMGKAQQRGP